MTRKKNKKRRRPIDFDEVGKTVAKLLDVKRRLIRASLQWGDEAFAHRTLEQVRSHVQIIREGLEIGLREGDLEGLTPEMAQQAIYGCHLLEASLQPDPEHPQ